MIICISVCLLMLGIIVHALFVQLPKNLLLLDALQMAMGPLDQSFLIEETTALPAAWNATDGHYLSITHNGICLGHKTKEDKWTYADVQKCMNHLQRSFT